MTDSSVSVLPGLKGYNPDNLQPWTVGVVASVTVLATVSVILRIVSRRIKQQPLWWDDYMIIFSLVRLLPVSNYRNQIRGNQSTSTSN